MSEYECNGCGRVERSERVGGDRYGPGPLPAGWRKDVSFSLALGTTNHSLRWEAMCADCYGLVVDAYRFPIANLVTYLNQRRGEVCPGRIEVHAEGGA